ncbi:MAG: glycoside hydrolase family 76 protein [Bacteroidota bacterium]
MKRQKTVMVILGALLLGMYPGCGPTEDKGARNRINIENGARVLVEGLQAWYNEESGLWETTSWWNGANVLTALIQYGQYNGEESIKELVGLTYEKTKEFEVPAQDGKEAWICSNYINDFYDDEGWWALAWMDAWEWTGDMRYLEMARIIFSDISTGWSPKCGGGLYWKKGLSYKGTISNILAFTLATRLHLAKTGNINGRSCLQWAMDIWQWIMDSELLNTQGLLLDGIRNKDGECYLARNVWTYNQGVALTGLANLHRITGNGNFMKSAHNLAEATITHMVNENGILKEINCEPDQCNSDAEQFKGIFMRHLGILNQYSPKKQYARFLELNTAAILDWAMDQGRKLPGVPWDNLSEKANAATTSSALDAFNAYLIIE